MVSVGEQLLCRLIRDEKAANLNALARSDIDLISPADITLFSLPVQSECAAAKHAQLCVEPA